MTIDLWTAIFLAVAGTALAFRQIALSPHNETFPGAPSLLRLVMFVCALFMAYVATLFFGAANMPGAYAGDAATAVALMMLGLAIYNVAMTLNLFRQRYRPEVWRRLNRATETVKRSCPPRSVSSWRGLARG